MDASLWQARKGPRYSKYIICLLLVLGKYLLLRQTSLRPRWLHNIVGLLVLTLYQLNRLKKEQRSLQNFLKCSCGQDIDLEPLAILADSDSRLSKLLICGKSISWWFKARNLDMNCSWATEFCRLAVKSYTTYLIHLPNSTNFLAFCVRPRCFPAREQQTNQKTCRQSKKQRMRQPAR